MNNTGLYFEWVCIIKHHSIKAWIVMIRTKPVVLKALYKYFINIEKIKKYLKKKNECAIFRIDVRGTR